MAMEACVAFASFSLLRSSVTLYNLRIESMPSAIPLDISNYSSCPWRSLVLIVLIAMTYNKLIERYNFLGGFGGKLHLHTLYGV